MYSSQKVMTIVGKAKGRFRKHERCQMHACCFSYLSSPVALSSHAVIILTPYRLETWTRNVNVVTEISCLSIYGYMLS